MGGCTGGRPPWNRDSGHPAQDAASFWVRRRARPIAPKTYPYGRQRVHCPNCVPCAPNWPQSVTDLDPRPTHRFWGRLALIWAISGPFGPISPSFGGVPPWVGAAAARTEGRAQSRFFLTCCCWYCLFLLWRGGCSNFLFQFPKTPFWPILGRQVPCRPPRAGVCTQAG